MNKLKYVVLFVIISSILTILIVFYNNSQKYERNGYELVKASKVICESCSNIITLEDDLYYNMSYSLSLMNSEAKVIKAFDDIMYPRVLFKSKDLKSVIVYYQNKEDSRYYISKFNHKGEQSSINGPYRYLLSNSSDINTKQFYWVSDEENNQYIISLNDRGEVTFNIGPFKNISILKESVDGVIVKVYNNETLKYEIVRYNNAAEIVWKVEANNMYNLVTFKDYFVYYTLTSEGKYIYKLDFDGLVLENGPYDRKYDSSKNWVFRDSKQQFFVTNELNNKKVITILDKEFDIVKQIEGYNFSKLTKSIDSDDLIFLNKVDNETFIVKINENGKEIFSKKINSDFTIEYFSSKEVIYSVTINEKMYLVYLDENGNKLWEKEDLKFSQIVKNDSTFAYVKKDNTDYHVVLRNESGKEIYRMGPSKQIQMVAKFNNGEFLFIQVDKNNKKHAIIVNPKGEVTLDTTIRATEYTKEQVIYYLEEDQLHVNKDNLIK